MDTLSISQPYKYKDDWLIWPNTVLDYLSATDCDDTIHGYCLSNKSIYECINECSKNCTTGYFIEIENNKTICVPILEGLTVLKDLSKDINPAYRLRPQSIYPELAKTKVSTFINTKKHSFPPDTGNIVFYSDIVTLEEKLKGYTIEILNSQKTSQLLQMQKNGNSNIEIIPSQVSTPSLVKYMPVRFGDPVQISVPGTSLIARSSVDFPGLLEWDVTTGLFIGNDLSFRIMPSGKDRKIGDVLTYDDNFLITYNDISVVVVNHNDGTLRLEYKNIQNIDTRNNSFQLVCKMIGYYCNNGKCQKIQINKTQTNGKSSRYNGNIVDRSPVCFGMCQTNQEILAVKKKQIRKNIIYWVILSIVSILSIIVIIYFLTRR